MPVEVKRGVEARGNRGLEEEMVAEVDRDYRQILRSEQSNHATIKIKRFRNCGTPYFSAYITFQ